jgi:hypothetical protein
MAQPQSQTQLLQPQPQGFGWRRQLDSKTNRFYYVHSSGKRQWQEPQEAWAQDDAHQAQTLSQGQPGSGEQILKQQQVTQSQELAVPVSLLVRDCTWPKSIAKFCAKV